MFLATVDAASFSDDPGHPSPSKHHSGAAMADQDTVSATFHAMIDMFLKESEKQLLVSMLRKYTAAFDFESPIPGRATEARHTIDTGDSTPLHSRPYCVSPTEWKAIQKEVAVMLERNAIELVSSPWSSPVMLVRKRDGTWRFCVDYRRLKK